MKRTLTLTGGMLISLGILVGGLIVATYFDPENVTHGEEFSLAGFFAFMYVLTFYSQGQKVE